jgi:transketolase
LVGLSRQVGWGYRAPPGVPPGRGTRSGAARVTVSPMSASHASGPEPEFTEPAAPDLAPPAGDLDARTATAVRMLAADAVSAAKSGHPGAPMGLATVAWELFAHHLRLDPDDTSWADRDRLVLSAGHASALLYSLGHLAGWLPMEELKQFRQWGSQTPGHPEYGEVPGVETTTGPLGAGVSTAVGLALAERMLAERAGDGSVDHRTWVIAGDGCLMEGISHEAASLAGTLGLDRMIVIWDDNDITIDAAATASCKDDVVARFASYGWRTMRVTDGEDTAALRAAFTEAAQGDGRPTLIAVRTVIGRGAPGVEGTSTAHGAPLSPAVLTRTKQRYGWPEEPFSVPEDVRAHVAEVLAAKRELRAEWARTFPKAPPSDGPVTVDLPADALPEFEPGTAMATRVASGKVLGALLPQVPELVGGSADLAGSTGTALDSGYVAAGDYAGRLIRFGIREHAMGGALNGLALHGLRPFGSTFLVFSDYMRGAIRLSALMGVPAAYILTHDSVWVGEDGPTHQPVEHVESLRLIPDLAVLRPADANETAACWGAALASRRPSALVLSRQNLPVLAPTTAEVIASDGCREVTVAGVTGQPQVALVATGSEVALAVQAAGELAGRGITARVVSVPWRERAVASGRLAELTDGLPSVVAEAGVTSGWRGVLPGARIIGIDRFGASAPGARVAAELGLTADAVVTAALEQLPAPAES